MEDGAVPWGGDGDGEISLRTDSPIAPRETYIDRVPSRIRCFLRHVFFPRVDDRSCDCDVGLVGVY